MMQRHYDRLVHEAEPRHRGLRFRIRSFIEKFQQ
jgi:hypothetical protein